ncbi:hypothetical protein CH339_03245 [Rhodobium orientis]|uniref:Peptidase M61 catalytic domain-containing protein n=2 Tax=Rhodobium orientis TaxID=34017 RepID=A0A327JUQ3_9HYPH|nr:hypothetical protein CH339_03245 [Rhodobium orientis]
MSGRIAIAVLALGLAAVPTLSQQSAPLRQEIAVGGATLSVAYRGDFSLPEAALAAWIRRSAEVIAGYYGRFPVDHVRLDVIGVDGTGVRSGKAFGDRGAYLRVMVGEASDVADLKKDWIMVHEMVHLALPRMPRRHDWLAEGLAVYVESIARMQAGDLDRTQVWGEFVTRMPHGLPKAGDHGLDNTPTWGRTYWGGAIFALVADTQIRKRTNGARSLRDALRGVLTSGGDFTDFWPIERTLAAADAATGTDVLMTLYRDWRSTPVDPDLDRLWKSLGVTHLSGRIAFDEDAPLAAMRRSMETGEACEVVAC